MLRFILLIVLGLVAKVPPAPYQPLMGAVRATETTCPEVSGVCLAPAGDGFLAASDERGVYHVDWDGTTTPLYVEEHMDCEGVTVDPATGDVYYVVERKQEVRRLRAPDYSSSELLAVISDVGLGTNHGLEALTWYKDGTLLLGNQDRPVLLMQFSPESGTVTTRKELTGVTDLSDLCYDPVRDVLWIADSEQRTINLCSTDGEVLAIYPVPFIDNGEGVCVDHANSCIWVGDDTTSRIYQIHFEGL